jgi:hypothetical protein
VREIFWEKRLKNGKVSLFVKKKFWEIFLKIWDVVYYMENSFKIKNHNILFFKNDFEEISNLIVCV